MAYITRSELRAFGTPRESTAKAEAGRSERRTDSETQLFLSHSSRDRDLVGDAVEFFRRQGVKVYVDWTDGEMPDVPSPETAERLKEKIRENRKFVLLASQNSLASRWVPWELGLADVIRGLDHMTVMPVREGGQDYSGSEYVAIYSTIHSTTDGDWAVVLPGSNNGIRLSYWLRR